jgi:lysophospholipase L1-like esterase
MRRIRSLLHLAATAAVALRLTACATTTVTPAAAPDATAPTGDGPLVAFYGDSYTLGTGASSPAKRWSTIVSEERGWREFNPSVNGLGFVNNRTAARDLPDAIIAEDPDIVIVTMGLNDAFSYDRAGEGIRDAIDDDFTRLRTELPDARIVVFEPFWYTGERPAEVDTIAGWVHEAADDIDADWVEGSSRWLDGHYADDAESWMAGDGIHPNDTGYAEMAVRADEALRALDPPL